MPSIQLCSPRARRLPWRAPAIRLPAKLLSPPVLLGAWALVSLAAASLPRLYVVHRVNRAVQGWQERAHETGKAIVQEWTLARPVPEFRRGDEADLRQRLEEDPLLRALVEPASGRVWIREGDRLRPPRAEEGEEPSRLVRWARDAAASGQSTWLPSVQDNPRSLDGAVLALAAGRWWEFRLWVPSARETERFLGRFIGPDSPHRFGITRYGRDPRMGRMNSQGRAMAPRALAESEIRPTFSAIFPDLSLAFGEPWVVGLWGTPAQEARTARDLRSWNRSAWAAYGVLVALLGAASLLQLHAARRDRLRADQLAFLAHSLKTPLTILKLRCDTIRNASLPREVQDSHVARIGDEVDRLVRIIEAGLDFARPRGDAPRADAVDAAFFRGMWEQMEPIFRAEGRSLLLEGEDTRFRAPLRALGPALNTLLENALVHGRGTATVRVRRRRGLVEIEVGDEGDGIPLERIQGLAAPGDAGGLRAPAAPGHGVGIFLLHRMALHEGWGLRFDAMGGQGFKAVLELPA